MGDGGLSVGGVLGNYFSKNLNSTKKKFSMYLGSSYEHTNKDILISSELKKLNVEDLYKFIAQELKKNKIFGIFQGKMEYGPRALGNRSIICSPQKIEINEILNKKLKRSEFMPFAPCVLAEDFETYFKSSLDVEDFKFMTFTCETKNICDQLAPAIVHTDKSARPQSIFKEDNSFLYNVLTEFKRETGIGMLINTSFNVHEEPIVESYEDAINCYLRTNMDMLVLNNVVLARKN